MNRTIVRATFLGVLTLTFLSSESSFAAGKHGCGNAAAALIRKDFYSSRLANRSRAYAKLITLKEEDLLPWVTPIYKRWINEAWDRMDGIGQIELSLRLVMQQRKNFKTVVLFSGFDTSLDDVFSNIRKRSLPPLIDIIEKHQELPTESLASEWFVWEQNRAKLTMSFLVNRAQIFEAILNSIPRVQLERLINYLNSSGYDDPLYPHQKLQEFDLEFFASEFSQTSYAINQLASSLQSGQMRYFQLLHFLDGVEPEMETMFGHRTKLNELFRSLKRPLSVLGDLMSARTLKFLEDQRKNGSIRGNDLANWVQDTREIFSDLFTAAFNRRDYAASVTFATLLGRADVRVESLLTLPQKNIRGNKSTLMQRVLKYYKTLIKIEETTP